MLPSLGPLATALALALPLAAGAEPQPGPGDSAPAAEQPPAPGAPSGTQPDAEPAGAPAPAEAAAPSPGASPAPATAPAPPPAAAPEEDTWIDVGHAFIEQRIFAPVLRLDRFFSDERSLDAERARSFVRWRNEVRLSEDASRPLYKTGLRANLRFPGLNRQLNRLRLVIVSDTQDALQSIFPRRPGEDENTLGAPNAGLRYYFLDTIVSHGDLGAGVLTHIPVGAYGQARLRAAVPLGMSILLRSALTGFWRTDTHFGTSAGLELERPLTASIVTRLGESATLTEVSQGIEWTSEAALLATLDEHTAGALGVTVSGYSRPNLASDGLTRPPDLAGVRLYTRLRRDVYRRWIFVEVEPELAWPWSLEKRRHRAWGVAFRLEVQFQGNEAPPPPPDEEPPEPKDPPPPDALPAAPGAG